MVGGALILIALLLVCGPLEGRFGGEREGASEPPAVASGPPEHGLDAVDAAAAGALAGAALGENAAALTDAGVAEEADRPVAVAAEAGAAEASAGSPRPEPAVVAGVAAGAGAAAEGTSGGGGGAPGSTASPLASELPPVSAGAAAATTAANTFDEARSTSPSRGLGPAVDLFPPPVAGDAPLAVASASQPFGFDSTLLRPCDDPGSGCRNVSASAGPLVVQTPPPVFRGRIPRDQR
jgi:hypothetical protein